MQTGAYPGSKQLTSAYGRTNRISRIMVNTVKQVPTKTVNTLDAFLNQQAPQKHVESEPKQLAAVEEEPV